MDADLFDLLESIIDALESSHEMQGSRTVGWIEVQRCRDLLKSLKSLPSGSDPPDKRVTSL